MVRQRARTAGFVLLDALAALALMTGSVLVTLAFFRAEVREVRNNQERFAALLVAESEIERLHTLRYDQIGLGENQPLALKMPSARGLKESAGTLTVKELEHGLKRAEVRIEWSSPKGQPLHVSLAEEFSAEASGQ